MQFTNLTALWLDWNRLTRVPLVFAGLTQLGACVLGCESVCARAFQLFCCPFAALSPCAVELKLEGNPLRRPRLQIVVEQGAKGLAEWAKNERDNNSGIQNRREGGTNIHTIAGAAPSTPSSCDR